LAEAGCPASICRDSTEDESPACVMDSLDASLRPSGARDAAPVPGMENYAQTRQTAVRAVTLAR